MAGVESVLALERELERARTEVARMRRRADQLERRMAEELERVRGSLRAEIVPYGVYEARLGRPAGDGPGSVSIPIERRRRKQR